MKKLFTVFVFFSICHCGIYSYTPPLLYCAAAAVATMMKGQPSALPMSHLHVYHFLSHTKIWVFKSYKSKHDQHDCFLPTFFFFCQKMTKTICFILFFYEKQPFCKLHNEALLPIFILNLIKPWRRLHHILFGHLSFF